MSSTRKFRFGDFELDLDAVQLRLNGAPVRLERRPLDLLILLVTRHGQMVTREDIVVALWPPKVVIDFEAGVNTLIRKVRTALGDSAEEPRFIETVQGRGYRFIGEVTSPAADYETKTTPGAFSPVQAAAAPVAASRRRRFEALILLLLVAVAIGATAMSMRSEDSEVWLAILPFEKQNEELAYLATRLADDTRDALALIDSNSPRLRLIGQTSASHLTDSEELLQEARGDGIDLLLRTSLRSDETTIRVNSTLIWTDSGEEVPLTQFDRALIDPFRLSLDLATAIAKQVRLSLSPEVNARIEQRWARSPAAYQMYQDGRNAWDDLTPSSQTAAIGHFRDAVAEDPDFALGWAGLAHALVTASFTIDARLGPDEKEDVSIAVTRALEIDENLSEVQLAYAYYLNVVVRDPEAGMKAAERAVELDPNNGLARMLLGLLLSKRGQHRGALRQMEEARKIEPNHCLIFVNSSLVAARAGDREQAEQFARDAIAIDDRHWAAHFRLGYALLRREKFEDALQAFIEAEKWSDRPGSMDHLLGHTLGRQGKQVEAEAILADLISRLERGDESVSPADVAFVRAGLGDID